MLAPPKRRQLLALAAMAIAPATSLPAVGGARAPQRPIRFGLTPVFLDDRIGLLSRWKAYLADALAGEVEFVQRQTYAQILDALREGQIEFGWICGYPFVLHEKQLRLVCVPRWQGAPRYRSYLIVPAGSEARRLEDLSGRNFAFSDPLSNSGFLYVQYLLAQRGSDAQRYFRRSFFTWSHRHVVEAVAERLADGGAVDGYVWEAMTRIAPQLASATRVIHRSPEFGFPPIVAGPRASTASVDAFRKALVAMPQDPRGREVLAELQLDGFGEEPRELFASIARMAEALR
ncbi:MAG: hypothetical protein ABS55_13260 [Lautropia sp. SCN 70-15]|nr:MAG: hypothetical protein ABS55_13260 [Lautropia sp. SCN 70-15]